MGGRTVFALHLRAADGDPTFTDYAAAAAAMVLIVLLVIAVVMIARRLYRDKPVLRAMEDNVTRLDEHEQYGGKLRDRIALLEDRLAEAEEQQQVEVRYRRLLLATLGKALDAMGEERPAELTEAERPKLRVIRGGVA